MATTDDSTITDAHAVTKMLSGDQYPQEVNIACPACGYDYSHIREVFTRIGSDPYEGGDAYPGTTRADQPLVDERRAALVIVIDGECEHAWEFIIQQHKGVNLLYARILDENAGKLT